MSTQQGSYTPLIQQKHDYFNKERKGKERKGKEYELEILAYLNCSCFCCCDQLFLLKANNCKKST